MSARIIEGEVTDSVTGEPLGYVNVYFPKSHGGTLTDGDGIFRFSAATVADSLEISSLGYKSKKIAITSEFMRIRLSPSTTQLNEIVVRPKKQKYSKKNNPAVELMERLRAQAPKYDSRRGEWYSYRKHERTSLGLNNYNFELEGKNTKKRFGFLKEYVDTSSATGMPFLSLVVKERLAMDIYSDKKGHKEIVEAIKSEGIDKAFDQDNIQNMLQDVFREIDIYGNDITLMQNRFVGPLSNIASNYYKYYITDSISIDGKNFVELTFAPHNPESMGFNGRMYVPANDSVLYVRKLVMRVPSAINLNYVKNLYVIQDFELDSNNRFHKVSDVMATELQLIPGTQEFYAERKTKYGNYSLTRNQKLDQWFAFGGNSIISPDAEQRNDEYWQRNRLIPLNASGEKMGTLLDRLREVPLFYWSEKVLTILVGGYVKTGRESKFDFGPVNTLVSANSVEGARFRIGGITTANLSKRWFSRGFVAYGTKDRRFKYRVEGEYSFVDKKYHSREFPMNGLRLSHEYDYDLIGQHYLFTNADNVFLSWKRKPSDKVTMRRQTQFSYIYENANGWSVEASLRHELQKRTRWLLFIPATMENDMENGGIHHYKTSSIFVKLRFAPGEKFYQSKSERMPINMDAPVVQLTYEYGPKGFLGSDFETNRAEISLQKRFWFSAFGYTDMILKGGMIWSSVYYPALIWGNANLSYTIQPESYSLMNPMEFASDHYLSWDVTYWGNGILFNRIPLIKKAKLREVITCKGLMGGLNKRNNPEYNKSLLKFPENIGTTPLTWRPYIELSAGIDNILTILRVDYVWRLTYRNTPDVDKSGVRVSLHFTF